MTANDLTGAIVASITEERGLEPASWFALADMLSEEGGDLAERPFRQVAEVALVAGGPDDGAPLAQAKDGDFQARRLCRLLARNPIARAQALSKVVGALGVKMDGTGAAWREVYRRIPYTGHANVSPKQRKIVERWMRYAEEAGDAGDWIVDAVNQLKTAAIAIAERLEREQDDYEYGEVVETPAEAALSDDVMWRCALLACRVWRCDPCQVSVSVSMFGYDEQERGHVECLDRPTVIVQVARMAARVMRRGK